ncbi:MAG: type 1 glutamine amidotransferase [Candidatus Shapirobacteria bacterium]|nr:type 1 glutamine amidotransferase [Candidatus Shapirobacteria bacterium]
MKNQLKKAVIITSSGFEEPEVIYPFYRLLADNFNVDIATDDGLGVSGKFNFPISALLKLNKPINVKDLDVKNYDIVIVPGGHVAPDKIRQIQEVLVFIKGMYLKNKIVASICHGPWVLISSGILKGVKATCYPSMVDDLKNAGAIYIDQPVVVDKNIITSRRPQDLPVFLEKIIELSKKYY